MLENDPYRLNSGFTDNLRDLEAVLCACLLREARLTSRRVPINQSPDIGPIELAFQAQCHQTLLLCQQLARDLEKSYLITHRYQEERATYEAQRVAFVEDF